MNSYRHLVVIDLSSYGSALALLNQFGDDVDVKVFEVSPMGSGALLVLLTKEAMAASVLKAEIIAHWAPSIVHIEVISDAHPDLLSTYLSQATAAVTTNILVLESAYVSQAMRAADLLLKKSISLIDFRIIRTFPSNSILIASHNQVSELVNFSNGNEKLKPTIISNVSENLRSYFEVLK